MRAASARRSSPSLNCNALMMKGTLVTDDQLMASALQSNNTSVTTYFDTYFSNMLPNKYTFSRQPKMAFSPGYKKHIQERERVHGKKC